MAFPAVASSTISSGNSLSCAKPSGLAVGDLLIAKASANSPLNHNSNVAAPDGTWTTLSSFVSGDIAFGTFWKYATSADVAASTFAFGTTGDTRKAVLLRVTGVDPATAILAHNSGSSSNTASPSVSGIAPAIQSLLLMMVGHTIAVSGGEAISAYAVANSNPTWTEDQNSSFGASNTTTGTAVAHASMTGASASSTGVAGCAVNTNSSNLIHIDIIAIQSPVYTAPTLSMAGSVGVPMFAKRITTATLHLNGTVNSPVVSIILQKIRNVAKHAVATVRNIAKH